MLVTQATAEQRVVLSGVSWRTFKSLLEETGPRRGRFAYDRGLLEIMSPSSSQKLKGLIGRFLETLSLTLGVEIGSYGSTTFLREEEERGLEPDECYYIQNEMLVRGKADLDMTRDPPPDLVVEVDLSRSSLKKFPIYRSLGVPEIWRFDGRELTVHHLTADGTYLPEMRSAAFPEVPLGRLQEFLARWDQVGETTLVREFAEWVRVSLAGRA